MADPGYDPTENIFSRIGQAVFGTGRDEPTWKNKPYVEPPPPPRVQGPPSRDVTGQQGAAGTLQGSGNRPNPDQPERVPPAPAPPAQAITPVPPTQVPPAQVPPPAPPAQPASPFQVPPNYDPTGQRGAAGTLQGPGNRPIPDMPNQGPKWGDRPNWLRREPRIVPHQDEGDFAYDPSKVTAPPPDDPRIVPHQDEGDFAVSKKGSPSRQGNYGPAWGGGARGAGAGAGGAAGGGGTTGPGGKRLALGDQRRTAAYDPTLDKADPRNVAITDEQGRVNPKLYEQSQKGALDPTKPGVKTGEAAAKFTNQYTNALVGATQYMADMFHQKKGDPNQAEGYAAMTFKGVGAPDPKVVADVFKVVDPNNELLPKERMELATRAMHDWYTSKGDKKNADKVAAEMLQHGNKQAQQLGNQALQAMKSGDRQGAVRAIQQAYDWLPDGYNADVKGNNLAVTAPDGRVLTSIPLDDKQIANLGTGLATGTLYWDVVQNRAGKPGTFTPPKASPTEAIEAKAPTGVAPGTPPGAPSGGTPGAVPTPANPPVAPGVAPPNATAAAPGSAPAPAQPGPGAIQARPPQPPAPAAAGTPARPPAPPAAPPAPPPSPPVSPPSPPPVAQQGNTPAPPAQATVAPPQNPTDGQVWKEPNGDTWVWGHGQWNQAPATPPSNQPVAPAPAAPGPGQTPEAVPIDQMTGKPVEQGGGEQPQREPVLDTNVPPAITSSTGKRPIEYDASGRKKPSAPLPVETKPVETKPAETKSTETKPAETKPGGRKQEARYVYPNDDRDNVPIDRATGKEAEYRRRSINYTPEVVDAHKAITQADAEYRQQQDWLAYKQKTGKGTSDYQRTLVQLKADIEKTHTDKVSRHKDTIKEFKNKQDHLDAKELEELKPKRSTGQDRAQDVSEINTTLKELVNQKENWPLYKTNPLRLYSDEKKWAPVRDVILEVQAHNRHMSTDEVTRRVVTAMSHLENGPNDETQTLNGKVGKDGARYRVLGLDLNNNVVIQVGGGRSATALHMPPETFAEIVRFRNESYKAKEAEFKGKGDAHRKAEENQEIRREAFKPGDPHGVRQRSLDKWFGPGQKPPDRP